MFVIIRKNNVERDNEDLQGIIKTTEILFL